jgi:twinkle protein
MPLADGNARASRGADWADDRIIPPDLDWRAYDSAPEQHKVRAAADYEQQVIDSFYGNREIAGACWPWDKANDHGLRFRPAEVTVYSGVNGERKSLLTGQIGLGLMRRRESVLVMSFEMRVDKTLKRMLRQSAGCREPALDYIKAWHRWSRGRLWLYDHLGNCSPRQAVAIARYAAKELGVKHIIVDSMMKVISKTDDYSGQKQFIGDLAALALAHSCHVHVVTHARKGDSLKDGIDKWSVKGASEITDQADNVVLISKNLDKKPGEYDQFLKIAKQRDGEYEGTLGLFFDPESLSFGEREGVRWPTIRMDLEDDEERAAIEAES